MVEGARLESVYAWKRIEGSNPFLSAKQKQQMFSVYILYSLQHDKYYIGQTQDLIFFFLGVKFSFWHSLLNRLTKVKENEFGIALNLYEKPLNLYENSMNVYEKALNLHENSMNVYEKVLNLYENSLNLY